MSFTKTKCAVISSQCVACGTCAKVCPVGAITIHKGCIAIVDADRCVGCGRCQNVCPASVISIAARGDA